MDRRSPDTLVMRITVWRVAAKWGLQHPEGNHMTRADWASLAELCEYLSLIMESADLDVSFEDWCATRHMLDEP